MTRVELVIRLSGLLGMPLRQAEKFVDTIINEMAESLASGRRIEIRGFGSFDLSYRPARKSRNPRTGETVEAKEKYFPMFKAGSFIRQKLNHF